MVGDTSGNDENNVNYLIDFKKKYSKETWFKNVVFKGYVTDEELADEYKSCDIFWAPSRYESFGQIYIEAMASGKAVIGTRVGGIPEIIKDTKNGFMIDNENSEQLHKILNKLIDNQELRKSIGLEARKTIAHNFTSTLWAKKMLNFIFESILNKT